MSAIQNCWYFKMILNKIWLIVFYDVVYHWNQWIYFHSSARHLSIYPLKLILIFSYFPFTEAFIKPTFTLSNRGNLKLAHDGYTYVRASSTKDSTRWRCSYSVGARYGCIAKALTHKRNGDESVTFLGMHCHPRK